MSNFGTIAIALACLVASLALIFGVARAMDRRVLKRYTDEVEALRSKGAAGVPKLIGHINLNNSSVNDAAYQAIVSLGPEAVPALLGYLSGFRPGEILGFAPSIGARVRVLTLLGEIPDPRSVPQLTADLKNGYTVARMTAATSLGKIKVPQAKAGLRASLDDRNSTVRAAVVSALAEQGDRSIICAAAAGLRDPDPAVGALMVLALAHFPDEAVPRLIENLKQARSQLAIHATMAALGELGDPRAVPPLIELMVKGSHFDWGRQAAAALIAIGQAAVPQLTALLDSSDEAVRENARRALAQIETGKRS